LADDDDVVVVAADVAAVVHFSAEVVAVVAQRIHQKTFLRENFAPFWVVKVPRTRRNLSMNVVVPISLLFCCLIARMMMIQQMVVAYVSTNLLA